MRLVSKSQRKETIEKFKNAIEQYSIGRSMSITCSEEIEELEMFLLTGCDVNDLIEYVDNKVLAWALSRDTFEKGEPRYRFSSNMMDAYKVLLDVVGEY